MRYRARYYLIYFRAIFLIVGSASANTCPSGDVPDRDPWNVGSHETRAYSICGLLNWIQARVNDDNFASHTAEFHDESVKLGSRETYAMYGIDKCSFTLDRHLYFVFGPYVRDGKKAGSSSRDFETIEAIDLKRMDPASIQTEMQSDTMHGQTAALILQTTAGAKALKVRRKSTVHSFDKGTPDATTTSEESISRVVIRFRDLEAADNVAQAFQLVIAQCGGIGIPNDVDPNSTRARFVH